MIRIIKLWILVSAACVCAGWLLSILHQVNLTGYLGIEALSVMGLFIVYTHRQLKGRLGMEEWPRWRPRRFPPGAAARFFIDSNHGGGGRGGARA